MLQSVFDRARQIVGPLSDDQAGICLVGALDRTLNVEADFSSRVPAIGRRPSQLDPSPRL